MADITFQQVKSERHKEAGASLIREYLEWLNGILQEDYGLAFEVDAMVRSDLSDPQKFHPPHGRFYLAQYAEQMAGVGCLKRLAPDVGELQRMYVLPTLRGKGIGRAIAERLIDDARAIGYLQLRLESLEFLHAAHALYQSLGFREIDPYADNSMEAYQAADQLDEYYGITVFMALDLSATA